MSKIHVAPVKVKLPHCPRKTYLIIETTVNAFFLLQDKY